MVRATANLFLTFRSRLKHCLFQEVFPSGAVPSPRVLGFPHPSFLFTTLVPSCTSGSNREMEAPTEKTLLDVYCRPSFTQKRKKK